MKKTDDNQLYNQAIELVMKHNKASEFFLGRVMGIGYQRAMALIQRMEVEGIVTPLRGSQPRAIIKQ